MSPVAFPDGEAAPPNRLISVAVWDVNAAVPGMLEAVVAAMNEAQPAIEFRVASLACPYGLWKVDAKKFGRTAYLPAERAAKRLKGLIRLHAGRLPLERHGPAAGGPGHREPRSLVRGRRTTTTS